MSDKTVQESGGPRIESTNSETVIADHSDWASFLRRQVPYISVLGLAIVGVAYTNMAQQPLVGYWEFLALATGVVCVVTEWPKLDDRQARLRLIWKQSVHWVAVLVAMNIMLLSGVQQFVPTRATSFGAFAGAGSFPRRTQLIASPYMLFGSIACLGGAGRVVAQAVASIPGVDRCFFGWCCGDAVAQAI